MKYMIRELLRTVGNRIPDIPKIRAFGNLVLWPIHRALDLGGGVVDVLGVKMELNPSECVDRSLWFSPQIYDRREMEYALDVLKGGGIFIDAGSNIGFWSLIIASRSPHARIYAIEANPETKAILDKNVALNGFTNIFTSNCGLAGKCGELTLHCGNYGNRGGDSFVSNSSDAHGVQVTVMSLSDYCQEQLIEQIDFMKMDIEGMENEVLTSFFAAANNKLWPKCMCVEILHSPGLISTIESYGYACIYRGGDNAVFVRR